MAISCFTLKPIKVEISEKIRTFALKNICRSNIEDLNTVFFEQKMPQSERLMKLNHIAIH